MLDSNTITRRVAELLAQKGVKPDLSEQAKAVTQAIVESINAGLLDLQATNEEFKKQLNAVKETPTGRMKKPTLDEVKAQGAKIGLFNGECEKFFDFYESKGWRVGGQPMKLWTAAMANWKRRNEQPQVTSANVLAVQNQTALTRVEDRIKYLRGQFPLADAKLKTEWNELRTERQRLMQVLGFKA